MADVSKISLNGTSYNIKDITARSSADNASTKAADAQKTANSATTTANNALTAANTNSENITKITAGSLSASYDSTTESVVFTKGITI